MNKLEYETIVIDDNKSNHHNIHPIRQEHSQIPNNNNNQHKHHHQQQQQQHNQNNSYNVNLKFEPQIPTTRKTTTLNQHNRTKDGQHYPRF